ncbi:hypothetical protein B0H13DRAFT_1918128 [Mycena leptocephala]|nr:hypothetical protein B0H13DRAFT_1918128 [Mycena leptocephala]
MFENSTWQLNSLSPPCFLLPAISAEASAQSRRLQSDHPARSSANAMGRVRRHSPDPNSQRATPPAPTLQPPSSTMPRSSGPGGYVSDGEGNGNRKGLQKSLPGCREDQLTCSATQMDDACLFCIQASPGETDSEYDRPHMMPYSGSDSRSRARMAHTSSPPPSNRGSSHPDPAWRVESARSATYRDVPWIYADPSSILNRPSWFIALPRMNSWAAGILTISDILRIQNAFMLPCPKMSERANLASSCCERERAGVDALADCVPLHCGCHFTPFTGSNITTLSFEAVEIPVSVTQTFPWENCQSEYEKIVQDSHGNVWGIWWSNTPHRVTSSAISHQQASQMSRFVTRWEALLYEMPQTFPCDLCAIFSTPTERGSHGNGWVTETTEIHFVGCKKTNIQFGHGHGVVEPGNSCHPLVQSTRILRLRRRDSSTRGI